MTKDLKKSSKNRGPAKNKNRMEEVYVKAAMLFRKKGYLRTSMNDIAKELNIQKGSLYYYVKDKETLLFEILDRTTNGLVEGVRKSPLKGLSTKEKLDYLILEHAKNIRQYENEIPLLVNEIRNLRPELKNIIISKRMKYEQVLLDTLKEGMSNNTFTKHDEEFLAFLVLGGIFWYYQWFSPGEENPPYTVAKNFSRIIFDGLLVKK